MLTQWLNQSAPVLHGTIVAFSMLAFGFGMMAGMCVGTFGYKRSEAFKFDATLYSFEEERKKRKRA